MKIIFLDIDGVLNQRGSKSRSPSGCLGIDSDKLDKLKQIVNETNAKIVLTSTWKTDWFKTEFKDELPRDGAYLEKKFRERGIYILDKTEEPSWAERGIGVISYIEKYKENVESFVVLDDESFDFESVGISDRFVHTSFETGLLSEHVEKSIKILNTELVSK